MISATRGPALVEAGPGDIDDVAYIVAAAFEPLQVIQDLVPDPARRKKVVHGWYRLHIEHAIGGAGHVVMTEDRTGAAVWFDRTGDPSEPEDYGKRLAELAGEDLARFLHLDHVMDTNHPQDPHWHLLFLAARPGLQRMGLGGRLMDYTHACLDADGIPAYLEATGNDNRRLYERYGYQLMDPPTIAVTGDTDLYRMWRAPQVV
jgi:ribosomal protein S18 acetylase RimI-like enzyme